MFPTLAFLRPPQGMEWIIILVIVLLIFGKRLPEMAKSLGKGIVEFKKGLKGVKEDLDEVDKEVDSADRRKELEDRVDPAAHLSSGGVGREKEKVSAEKSATSVAERTDRDA